MDMMTHTFSRSSQGPTKHRVIVLPWHCRHAACGHVPAIGTARDANLPVVGSPRILCACVALSLVRPFMQVVGLPPGLPIVTPDSLVVAIAPRTPCILWVGTASLRLLAAFFVVRGSLRHYFYAQRMAVRRQYEHMQAPCRARKAVALRLPIV